MTFKAGIVFFEYTNREELSRRMKNLYDHMRIEVLE